MGLPGSYLSGGVGSGQEGAWEALSGRVETLDQAGGAGWRWPAVEREGKGAGENWKMGKSLGEAGALPW